MARPADLAWFLSIETGSTAAGQAVLKLTGRLGKAAAARLEAGIRRAIDAGNRQILLDLSDLDYINSAGLAVLDRAAADLAARGGSLMLTEPQGALKVAMDLAGPIPHATIVQPR